MEPIHFIEIPTTKHYCQGHWLKPIPKPENITQVEFDTLPIEKRNELVHCQNLAVIKTKDGGYLCGDCASIFNET